MLDFKIHIDTHSARFFTEIESGGNILCNIHLLVGGEAFPGDPWLDFPVIILAWWLEGYLRLTNTGKITRNSFMNGPFEYTTKVKDGNILLSFRQRTLKGNKTVRSPVEISLEQYKQELLNASDQLLSVLDQYHRSGRDYEELKSMTVAVRAL